MGEAMSIFAGRQLLSRLKDLSQEGVWIILGQFGLVLGSLVSVRVLTEILPPPKYGELALGMTIAAFVNQSLMGPLSGGLTRYYAPALENGTLPDYLDTVRHLTVSAIALMAALGLLLVLVLVSSGLGSWAHISAIALAFAILTGTTSIVSGIFSAARRRALVALYQGLDPWLRLGFAVVLTHFFDSEGYIALMGYVVGALTLFVIQWFSFRSMANQRSSRGAKVWRKDIIQFSWPIGVFGIFTWMQLTSDRWALQVFSSAEEVGRYAALYQLGYYPIALMSGMVMQLMLPILYQRAGDATDKKRVARVTEIGWSLTWLTIGATLLLFLVMFWLKAYIFKLLVAPAYQSAAVFLPWLLLSGGLFAAGQVLASNLQAQLRTREMMSVKVGTAVLGVIFNFAGAYYFELPGVIAAGLLFSLSYLVGIATVARKEGKYNVELGEVTRKAV